WVNGIANAIFVLLAITGIYLWLPKRYNRRAFKKQLTLPGNYTSTKARDYQWHNVFGIYLTPVLFVLASTALFFSFDWPGDGLKKVVSTETVKELAKPTPLESSLVAQIKSTDTQIATLKAAYPSKTYKPPCPLAFQSQKRHKTCRFTPLITAMAVSQLSACQSLLITSRAR
ncbi:MAG: PepSY domain-containing protein, partial [Psychrobium sp.]